MKRNLLIRWFAVLFLVFAGSTISYAQISQGGSPQGLTLENNNKIEIAPFEVMPEFDLEALRKEDAVFDGEPGVPWRFGNNFDVNLNPENSGVWHELEDGSRLWRLGVASKGALSLNFGFDRYKLPDGAKLFIYTPTGKNITGAFTSYNNQEDGHFGTAPIIGDAVVIEYHEPKNAAFEGELNIFRITHGYRGVGEMVEKGFGDSGACNLNVACPEAEGWDKEIRSVVKILRNGSDWCTGAMINNTENDGTPFFLTADHCYASEGTLVFVFNWESETCANPSSAPPMVHTMSGAVTRARNAASDAWLLEFNDAVPEDFNVYFAGWNRELSDVIEETIVGIHHPSGDIKKFSYSDTGVQRASYLGAPNSGTSHWRITWDGGTTTEPGSSGSPIFDAQGRILGQLHGGYAACGNTDPDWYGRLGVSWDGGLSQWLDPNGSDVDAILGFDPILDAAEPGSPAAVVDLTVVPGAEGALNATLSWTNPSETFDGGTLSDLTAVNIYRAGELIHTVASPTIGAEASYVDNDVAESGNYVYVVKAENADGEGPQEAVSVFVGPDTPGAVQNVALADQDNDGFLTWEIPVAGANDGYFDPSSIIEYQITRNPATAEFTVPAGTYEFLDETLPGMGYYTYTIVAVNAIGEGAAVTSPSVLLASEGAVFMGDGTVTTCSGTFFDSGGPDSDYQNNEDFTLTFFPETEGAKMHFQFTEFNVETGWDFLYVYDGDEVNPDYLVDQFSGTSVPAPLADLTSTHATGAITFRFTSDGSVTTPGWSAIVSCFIPAENDLRGVSIAGNTTPSVGVEFTYNVAILNLGALDQQGADYTVEIRDADDNVLASAPGQDIAADEALTIPVAWTPDTEGAMSIHGYVNFAADENPDNNATNPLNVNVQPEGVLVATIGDGDKLASWPFNFFWDHSISQTLYYSEEMGIGGGVITALQYTNSFNEALEDKSIQIWLGETDANDLSDGWVPTSDLQLVFDGTLDFPEGANAIYIEFEDFYVYGGGNLVVYSTKADDSWSSGKNFFNTEDPGSNRTRRANRDGASIDPENPDLAGALSHDFANVSFFLSTEGLGSIEGMVTDAEGVALEGVAVNVVDASFSTVTNADGEYIFPYLLAGTYTLEFSKFGYYNTLVEDVVLEEDGELVVNATLDAIATYSVFGNVIASDTELGLEGAIVKLTGYQDYEVLTDLEGDFIIEDVYENQEYTITVSYPDYSVYTATIEVEEADLDLGTIMVEEIAYPVSGVLAEIVEENDVEKAWVTWNEPVAGDIWAESFEEGSMPENWTQIVNNTGSQAGIPSTWHITGTVDLETPIVPQDGDYQAFIMWSYDNQDEWLITPEFIAPAGDLVFWYYGSNGSPNADNYYVKISEDGGDTWNVLWNASDLPAGENPYDAPAVIDLSDYAGQDVHIAWNNVDGPTNDGLWYAWGIDNISIGGQKIDVRDLFVASNPKREGRNEAAKDGEFMPSITIEDMNYALDLKSDKVLESFNVYRFLAENQADEQEWTLLAEEISEMEHLDETWDALDAGVYRYAVKAIYTNDVLSPAAFSNMLPKDMHAEVTVNITTNSGDSPEGAVVRLANQDGDPMHIYSMEAPESGIVVFDEVWKGTYNILVTLPLFDAYTEEDLSIWEDEVSFDIELIETLYAPSGLAVNTFGLPDGEADFSWNLAGGAMAEFRYDDGVVDGQLGFQGDINSVMGSVHHRNAEINEVSWFLTDEAGPYATVKVWVLGLTDNGTPDRNNVLYSNNSVANVHGEWNTYELSSSVQSEGFFIGISADGFLGLAIDDGVGEPYDFVGGTQFGVFDINDAESEFTDIDVWGFQVNYLLRAYGLDFGEAKFANTTMAKNASGPAPIMSKVENSFVAGNPASANTIKALQSFNVYLGGDEVATGVTDMQYTFTGLEEGVHTAGIEAVYTTGTSEMATVEFEMVYTVSVTINVTTNSGDSPEGAMVALVHQELDEYVFLEDAPASGTVVFDNVRKGMYDLAIGLDNHHLYVTENVDLQADLDYDAELIEIIETPFGLLVEEVNAGEALFSWNNFLGAESFEDSFEDGTFEAWEEFIQGPGTPGDGGSAYWHVGDPDGGSAPDGSLVAKAHWGFNIDTWLITPAVAVDEDTHVSFYWNSSYHWSVDPEPNAELMVQISTDGGETWEEIWNWQNIGVWENWTWYNTLLSLDQYIGQSVHIGFQLLADDNANVEIDNIEVGPFYDKGTFAVSETPQNVAKDARFNPVATKFADKAFVGYNVFLNGNLVASDVNTTEYLFAGLAEGNYTAGVQSLYSSGNSEIVEIAFEIEEGADGHSVVYFVDMSDAEDFDPAVDQVFITGSMLDWAEPGTQHSLQALTRVDDSMIFTITHNLPEGTYEYKYFLNEGWEGGEWEGMDDRILVVEGDMEVHDVWGDSGTNVSEFAQNIKLYPNPAQDLVNIVSSDYINRVMVTDLSGRNVYSNHSVNAREYQLRARSFENGVYIVRVYTESGILINKLQIQK